MLSDEVQTTLEALQMGLVYSDEIGDEAGLEQIKSELELLVSAQPSYAGQVDALLSQMATV